MELAGTRRIFELCEIPLVLVVKVIARTLYEFNASGGIGTYGILAISI